MEPVLFYSKIISTLSNQYEGGASERNDVGKPLRSHGRRLLRSGNERMVKYLRIMRRDPSFDDLCEAVENQDYQAAFRAAHAIKGASLNLGLTKLADCSSKLTEALRSQEPNEAIAPLFKETKQVYQEAIARIDALPDHHEQEQVDRTRPRHHHLRGKLFLVHRQRLRPRRHRIHQPTLRPQDRATARVEHRDAVLQAEHAGEHGDRADAR